MGDTKGIKMHATFTGQNGSLGYEFDFHYIILVKGHTVTRPQHPETPPCVYESLEAFLKNWTEIEIINEHD